MVAFHGLGRTSADWDAVRPTLERFGALLTPQLPKSPSEGARLVDASIAEGDVVIGHSMGGVLALRALQERPRSLRGVVLTNCFFPPARNGRTMIASTADYLAHRVAFLRERSNRSLQGSSGSAKGLSALVRMTIEARGLDVLSLATSSVLVIHARDDHYVPVDFALGAAARHRQWDIRLFDSGGHHLHVTQPDPWAQTVVSWLDDVLRTAV